jgi:ribosome biogenesis GTPase / thiamine phosphate phosphatase
MAWMAYLHPLQLAIMMLLPDTPMIQGRVIQSTGAWYQVKGEDGLCYACQLRGKLRLHASPLTNPVAVGDEVAFEPVKSQATGVIYKIMPRRNYLIRQAPYRKSYGQLLAANLDQAFLVVNALTAPTQLDFIDRFLVVAEAFAIPPRIVFNKIDLLDTIRQEALAYVKMLYEKLGYVTLAVSAHTHQHLASFRQALLGKVSLLSGHSGVGKSTLVNTIASSANRAIIAPTSRFSQKGQHTTTYTTLLEVLPGTFVIDTPGIQTLVPYAVEKKLLSHCFPEMCSRASACKFYNCTHQHEPNCAVVQALEKGEIAASRYGSYRQLAAATNE